VNPLVGWFLAVAAVGMAAKAYGWQGAVFAVTVVVFWLLLQLNRALRTMKRAASRPVGHVDSAVMLNARLRSGMTMLQIIGLTRSLGRRVSTEPEVWRWQDDGDCVVTLALRAGKLHHWKLDRRGASAEDG
jgi:hypothetical protein